MQWSFHRTWGGLVVLVLAVVLGHLALRPSTAGRALSGDEILYYRSAHRYAASGRTSVLPGRLEFEHRPTFYSHLLSNLVEGESELMTPVSIAGFRRRVTLLHLILLPVVIAAVAWQTRALRGSVLAASLAGGLLATFPWFGFYVHALWPEVLHASCAGLGLALVCQFFDSRRPWLLMAAGIALGCAALIKGSLTLFLPVAVLAVGLEETARRERLLPGRLTRGLRAAALLVGGIALVVAPQLLVNHQRGVGWRIAANKWRNIEWGLTLPTGERSERLRVWEELSERYRGPTSLLEREEAARQRVQRVVAKQEGWHTLRAQVGRLVWLVQRSESRFERHVSGTAQNGGAAPAWWPAARLSARAIWFLILAGGLVGAAAYGWRSAAGRFSSLYLLYFLVALLVVPTKLRFAMPAVPVLCVFAGLALAGLAERLRLRAKGQEQQASA